MQPHLKGWKSFLERMPGRPPLRYLAGWVHPVRPDSYCRFHSHSGLEIVYHRPGCGTTSIRNGGAASGLTTFAYRSGSVVIYAPGAEHDQTMASEGDDVCVQIEIPPLERPPLTGGLHVGRVENPVVFAEIESLAENRVASPRAGFGSGSGSGSRLGLASRAALDLRASAVLTALLEAACADHLEPELPRAERRVRKAEEFMREHLGEIRSLREVAEHAGISHDHLRHLFLARRGQSLVGMLNEMRVTRAKSLLRHSRMEIKEIAGLCGFRDVYYFSAVFSRVAKCPPARYRQRNEASLP